MKHRNILILLSILLTLACLFASCNANKKIFPNENEGESTSDDIDDYTKNIQALENKIIELQQNQELSDRAAQLETDKEDLIRKAAEDKAAFEQKEASIRSDCEKSLQALQERCDESIGMLKNEHREEKNALEEKLSRTNELLQEKQESNLALHARLHAYQWKNGTPADEDLTERESFLQLEAEREWFKKMFKATWAQTKKRIRQEAFAQVLNGESMPEEYTNSDENDNNGCQTEENENITN